VERLNVSAERVQVVQEKAQEVARRNARKEAGRGNGMQDRVGWRAVRHSRCDWGSCCWCGKFRGWTGSIVRGKITCREGMKGSTVPSFDIAEIPVLVQKVDMTQFSRWILASYVTHGRTEEPQQSPLGVTLHIRRSGHLSTRSLQSHRRLQSLCGLTRLYSDFMTLQAS
jgi:hypothetical protein